MTMTFSTLSRLERVLYTRDSPLGDPYAVALATSSDGKEHTVLACSKKINLDYLRLLEGMDLALQMTENGPQVKPLSQQPPEVQEHLFAALEAGEGHRASKNMIPHLEKPAPVVHNDGDADNSQRAKKMPDLNELAINIAKLSHELGLPTAMWIHIPTE